MRLFLLGATGRTGRLVLQQALARGHAVTAIVRTASALDTFNAHASRDLRIVVGNPLASEALAPQLHGHDVLVSCLGQRSRRDATVLHQGAAAALDAMARSGIRRYLVISQGLLFPSGNPLIALLRFILARHVADSEAMERLVRSSAVDWTIVRPPRLVEGAAPRGYRAESGALPGRGLTMQYADLAAFLVDEAERQDHRRQVVGVAPK